MKFQKKKEGLLNFYLIKHDFSSKAKKNFLCICFLFDLNISLKDFKRKNSFVGLNRYECMFLCGTLFSANSKIFRLHAILKDAAGSVKYTTHKGPGQCCVLPRFRSS